MKWKDWGDFPILEKQKQYQCNIFSKADGN